MTERVLVALGGNAILKHKDKGTSEEQFENIRETCKNLMVLFKEGYRIAITHGNGPQVGDIILKNDLAQDTLPPMPTDVCGGESQGMIGYMLQQCMRNELKSAGLDIPVATVLTQTLVDKDDSDFKNPTKPIGPFYTAMEASNLREQKGWTIIDDSGRGYRRVVASPNPIALIENEAIKNLFDDGIVVIASGGGGIPVVADENGMLRGVEAVIDKDLAAAIFAKLIGAEILLILTDVEKVALNYGRPDQKDLDDMTIADARKYASEGQFAPGSMGPKVESAIRFIESGGDKAIIASIEGALDALQGRAGTTIRK